MVPRKIWMVACTCVVGVSIIAAARLLLKNGHTSSDLSVAKPTDGAQSSFDSQSLGSSTVQNVVVGGVLRPATDVKLSGDNINGKDLTLDVKEKPANPYGRQAHIDPATNPNVASVYAALKEKSHPERLSPFMPPSAFDAKAYAEIPQKYLSVVEPGRVWQSAQPGQGIPVLASVSSTRQSMKLGESVRLSVKTGAGQPVTFTSFDLGSFENQLNSISVAADASGVAEATFTASPGSISVVSILAASPTASGNVRFVLDIKPESR